MADSNQTTSSAQIYVYFSFISFSLATIGLIANVLLIYIFITGHNFRNITYRLMLICVVSDTISNIVSLISTGMLLGQFTNPSYSMIQVCRVSGMIFFTSYGISILNLCLIGIDRYFSIVKPFYNPYKIHKRRIIIICEILIVIIASSVTVPDLLYLQSQDKDKFLCDYENITISISAFLISYTAIYYILPSFVIIITYWRIIIHQRNYVRPGQHIKLKIRSTVDGKKKLVKSLIGISSCYVVATLPYFLIMFIIGITRMSFLQIRSISPALFAISLLAVSSTINISVINPFLYLKFDGNIRQRLMEMISSCRRSRRIESNGINR